MICACGCGRETGRSTHRYLWGHKPAEVDHVNGTEKAKARKVRWYYANKEKAAKANKAYRDKYREQYRATKLRNENVRRARKLGATGVEHVEPLIVLEVADGVCGICGEDVDPLDFHVDHMWALADGGDHTYENSQPAHPFCNRSKGAR